MKSTSLLSLTIVLIASACNSDETPGDMPTGISLAKSSLARASDPSADDVAAVGVGNRAFAFDLYQRIAESSPGQNVVFSPYSLSTAFAMTYAGARNQTHDEMKSTLHFDVPDPQLHEAFNAIARGLPTALVDDDTFHLEVNNSLWADKRAPIEPAFLDTLAVNYGAGVFLPDFVNQPEAARKAINAWVSQRTAALIPMLIGPGVIDAGTRFVLTNTVYLKAKWRKPFDPQETTQDPFTKPDGSTVTASFMRTGEGVVYAAGDGYQAAALPYVEDSLEFIAILPDEGKFDMVEASLSQTWFDALTASWNESAFVSLPKLDFSQHVSLVPQLRALGMLTAFEADADFSGMTSEHVVISHVIHQAALQVYEQGSTAAAATAIIARDASVTLSPHHLTFDRPFLFAIFDSTTGELLFLGRVLDPAAK
jgi:serpin B